MITVPGVSKLSDAIATRCTDEKECFTRTQSNSSESLISSSLSAVAASEASVADPSLVSYLWSSSSASSRQLSERLAKFEYDFGETVGDTTDLTTDEKLSLLLLSGVSESVSKQGDKGVLDQETLVDDLLTNDVKIVEENESECDSTSVHTEICPTVFSKTASSSCNDESKRLHHSSEVRGSV